MKLLYLDCFAGISGDMFLGAMLDLGLPEEYLRAELAKLHLADYRLSTRRVTKQNIAATKFDCEATQPPPPRVAHEHHRHYTDIVTMIEQSKLPQPVVERALRIFRRIGDAEAHIHGIPLEQVHFHEVGAIDSIVDVVGACIALEWLQVEEVQASPPRLGSGFVETAHGRFPVPAPATLELLKGLPTQPSEEVAELVTPTGAALLAEFCTVFGPLPAMKIQNIGYGAGTRDLEKIPNVLRAVLGTTESKSFEEDTVAVIETNIDDMNPQLFGELMERLLAAGALEVFLTAVQMKKNRPGTLVTVLCERAEVERFADLLLSHTTSFGVRVHECWRCKLAREIVTVKTRFGDVEVKVGRLGGKVVARSPEFESCKRTATAVKVTVKEVYDEVARVAKEMS